MDYKKRGQSEVDTNAPEVLRQKLGQLPVWKKRRNYSNYTWNTSKYTMSTTYENVWYFNKYGFVVSLYTGPAMLCLYSITVI